MSFYDVTVRKILDDGQWEEWVSTVEAPDRAAALAKDLRRLSSARYLLEGARYRFKVEKA
jgi:hypothetical protein